VTVSDPAGPRHSFESAKHSIYYNGMLADVLEAARRGTLAEDWRTRIRKPHANPDPTAELAIEEIRLMPVQLWEPGAFPGWRPSLERWYSAARSTLANQHIQKVQTLLTGVRTAVQVTPAVSLEMLDRIDQANDDAHARVIGTYTRSRDLLRADYLAGLAAGGARDGVDWYAWLQNRVLEWPADIAQTFQGRLTTEAFRATQERLPSYWTDT